MSFKLEPDRKNRKVFLQIGNARDATKRGIRQGFFRLGSALRETLRKDLLAKDKRGRIYKIRRGKVRRRHRASAPGQTPASLSGNYRKNVGYQIHGSDELEFGIRNVNYADFLERGTSRMKPRPGLGNTVKKMQGQANEYFNDGLKSELLKK